jgi:hypothetical protein
MSDYPEHEKLRKISDQSQICGEFLEWLKGGYQGSPGLHLCQWKEAADVPHWVHDETGEEVSFSHRHATANPEWYPAGYYSPGRTTQELLAQFFGIDQKKIDAEKEQMLADIRAANAA